MIKVDKKNGTHYVDFQCPARRRTLKISAAFLSRWFLLSADHRWLLPPIKHKYNSSNLRTPHHLLTHSTSKPHQTTSQNTSNNITNHLEQAHIQTSTMRFSLLLFLVMNSHLFLTHASQILNRVPQFPPSPTPPPLKDSPSCQLVGEALAICGSLTPSFKDLPATSQANCLCYSSTIWAPDIFDSAVKYCADYASTAAASAYPAQDR
jgi:hypothetical protein